MINTGLLEIRRITVTIVLGLVAVAYAGSIESATFRGVTSSAINTAGCLDWGYVSASGIFHTDNAAYQNTVFGVVDDEFGKIITMVSGSSAIGPVTLTEGDGTTWKVHGSDTASSYTFDGSQAYGTYRHLGPDEKNAWEMRFNDLGNGTFTICLYLGHSAGNRNFLIEATLSDGDTDPSAQTASGEISKLGSTVAANGNEGVAFTYKIVVTTTSATDDLSLSFSSLSGEV